MCPAVSAGPHPGRPVRRCAVAVPGEKNTSNVPSSCTVSMTPMRMRPARPLLHDVARHLGGGRGRLQPLDIVAVASQGDHLAPGAEPRSECDRRGLRNRRTNGSPSRTDRAARDTLSRPHRLQRPRSRGQAARGGACPRTRRRARAWRRSARVDGPRYLEDDPSARTSSPSHGGAVGPRIRAARSRRRRWRWPAHVP